MHNFIRLTVFPVFLCIFFSACGSAPDCSGICAPEEVGEVQQVQGTACRVGMDCGGEEPVEPLPPATKVLTIRLKNASGITRECSNVDTARYASPTSGELIITTVAPGGLVASGSELVGSLSLPQGTSVSANGGCWRVGAPTLDYVYGSFPISLTTNKDCTIVYSETGGIAHAQMECINY